MTPEQEQQVARALAETARREPVPPVPDEVAARLDDVLADLVRARGADAGDTSEAPPGASVDEVAERRRRRRPNVLTAAAAVALIVAAGGAVLTGGYGIGSQSDSDSSSAGSTSTLDAGSPDAVQGEAAPDYAAPAPSAAPAAVPRLRTSSLAEDVRRVLANDLTDAQLRLGPRRKALSGPPEGSEDCVAPSVGPGERVLAVRLDGRPATLVLGPVRAGTRSAEVYSCGQAARPEAATMVRLP